MARPSPNPLWSRAPLGLLRFRALFAAIAGAFALLVLAVGVAPLFLSATANAGLRDALRDIGPFGGGLSVIQNDAIDPQHRQHAFLVRGGASFRRQTLERREKALSEAVDPIEGVETSVVTIMGDEVVASSPSLEHGLPVRPITRTGAAEHVRVLSSVPGDGILLPDIIAKGLHVRPGDTFRLSTADFASHVRVRVRGIYRALSEIPVAPFWQPLEDDIQLHLPVGELPPPFVIATRAQATELIEALTPRVVQFRWEFPLADMGQLTIAQARKIEGQFTHVTTEIGRSDSPLGKLFFCHCFYGGDTAQVSSLMEGAVRSAENREAGLSAPLSLISNAGALIALVLLGAAAAYEVYRRRTETVLLLTRGMRPSVIGARATLEAVLPGLVGVFVGYLSVRWLIGVLLAAAGPDQHAIGNAIRRLELATVAGTVIFWAASTVAANRRLRGASQEPRRGFAPLWELPVIGLALYGLLTVLHRESLIGVEGGSRGLSSSLILLFPLALIGGVSGLVARAFKRVLGHARRWSRSWPDAPHLAVRRLAAAPQLAVLLFSACGLALGTFVYSQTTGTTLQENAAIKAYVFVGSDVSAPANADYELPQSFPYPWTIASQVLDQASIDGVDVDVVGVDSSSVAGAVYWNESFSDSSIDEIAARLAKQPAEGLNVATTNAFGEAASLEVGGVEIPVHEVAHLRAFPEMVAGRNLVVVDSAHLRDRVAEAGGQDVIVSSGAFTSLLIKGDDEAIQTALLAQGFTRDDILTTGAVLDQPVFVAIRRSFAFLQVLGLTSSMIVIVGLLLYLQAKQAQRTLSLALAERMGLSKRAHRAALFIELGTMLLLALIVGGAVGIEVSSLLFKRLDPLPSVAPAPSLFLPVKFGVALIVSLIFLAMTGSFAADRAARRASITEVLRYE